MGTIKRVLIGFFSVVFLVGGVTMVTSFGSEAEAKKKKANHKSLGKDHDALDGKINMLKDSTEVLEENQTMMKEDIATILEKVMNGGGGMGDGGWDPAVWRRDRS